MARKRVWAKLFLFGMLELGAVCGVPIRPDDIERVCRLMNGTAVVEVLRRTDDGDGEPPGASPAASPAASTKLPP